MRRAILTGRTFGLWTVQSEAPSRTLPSGGTRSYWNCICTCGEVREVWAGHLVGGRTRSCGCLKRELAAAQMRTHGGRHSLLYEVWTQMIQRCENTKNKSFSRYGGRGIKVCSRWHEFSLFEADMSAGYSSGMTLDRKNNDGNYEPSNCRWVTNLVNCRNTSKTLFVDWEGTRIALSDLADQYGIKRQTLYGRVRLRGVPLAKALGIE